MDLNKFTQKSLQAVQDCQKLAYQYGNQKIEQEHLLLCGISLILNGNRLHVCRSV